jgi:hypothetical protein
MANWLNITLEPEPHLTLSVALVVFPRRPGSPDRTGSDQAS